MAVEEASTGKVWQLMTSAGAIFSLPLQLLMGPLVLAQPALLSHCGTVEGSEASAKGGEGGVHAVNGAVHVIHLGRATDTHEMLLPAESFHRLGRPLLQKGGCGW